jgi:hypothetical protein
MSPSTETSHPVLVDCADFCGQTRTVDVDVAHRRDILAGAGHKSVAP